jgi:hypothetical protein
LLNEAPANRGFPRSDFAGQLYEPTCAALAYAV